ncbi:uncharacterized protein E0L32_012210 [Thyridium curvatum]|uniref:GPI inositol-deacylase winged helix domain-containing protein n=1 Tax=Thyridium curvatum TaxID=1093900 RepID=A0A507BCR5_9PEZI|nr:uncharacterized protein E0L32_012210 [Thyridium curvatum]TPX17323.1 hypothetical protein E0L32_012210 [Thyridium curvatum]
MEAIYERMASAVQVGPSELYGTLGEKILAWATFARRPLSIKELNDALEDNGILEIHRTIGDLCGGLVVVDQEGRVSLIHQTAREYLCRSGPTSSSIVLDTKAINNRLFRTCVLRLMGNILRAKITQGRPPALLAYAASDWAYHLSRGSPTGSQNTGLLLKFLQGPAVLTWIQAAAETKQLRALVVASRQITEVVEKLKRLNDHESLLHRQAIEVLSAWATDLVKLVGKFGAPLLKRPDAIYKLIPPFCPEMSAVLQQFGVRESKTLSISGLNRNVWDDCLARLLLESGLMTSAVLAAGSRIAVLTNRKSSGCVFLISAYSFEEERRLNHGERVHRIQVDKTNTHLLSYGRKTTKVWDIPSGECLTTLENPSNRPRPHSVIFVENTNTVLVAGEDRIVRSFNFGADIVEWVCQGHIEQETSGHTLLNAPICSALSPDGEMIAFGYRGYPVTVWHLRDKFTMGRCNMAPDGFTIILQENALGEIIQFAWHPFSGEVIGLQRDGILFKWNPCDDEPTDVISAGAHSLCVSADGSLVATGDTVGTIKVYTTDDLSLLYQPSSQDAILGVDFSADSRRVYDIRASYGNVWEPNALVRLAESSECTDHSSDSWRETETTRRKRIWGKPRSYRSPLYSTR